MALVMKGKKKGLKKKVLKKKVVEPVEEFEEGEGFEEEAPAKKVIKKKPKSKLAQKKAENKSKNKTASTPSFLKTGKAAKEAIVHEKEVQALRDAEFDGNKVFRFRLKPNEEQTVTFLDGGIDSDGDLDSICFYEHQVKNAQGHYPNYVCINDAEEGIECPICATGDTPYFATVFTVLVHNEWVDKDKVTHEGSIMLFIAKPAIADRLRKKAKKLGGLAGVTMDISRSGEKMSSNVGDDFDVTEQYTMEELAEGFPEVDLKPLDYEEVLPYFPLEQLEKMGFSGNNTNPVGGEDGLL